MKPLALSLSLVSLSALLTGCTLQTTAAPTPISIPALRGNVHGGNQPVVHAKIQLYAVGIGDYASPATPLITSTTVYTGSDGDFLITGDFHCPSPSAVDTQVYLTATGGNPGLDGDPDNSALALMTTLGSCSALSASTSININELTTVASVWSLAQFMSGYASVGVTSTNYNGLKNAFFTSTQLVSNYTGIAVPSTTTTTIPAAELDTLANILSDCVNSTGDTSTPNTPCSKLFTATTPTGGTAPTDTIGAALNIALHPLSNVANIFSLASANPAFEPNLTSAPPDWTVGILTWNNTYTKFPNSAAVDSDSNYWQFSTYQAGAAAVSGPSAMYTTGGFFFDFEIPAFGLDGTLYGLAPGGVQGYGGDTSSSQFTGQTGGGIIAGEPSTSPISLAIGPNGNLWMPLLNGTVAEFTPPNTPVSPAGGFTDLIPMYFGGEANDDMAFDSNGNLYILDAQTTIQKIDTNPTTPTATTISGGGLNYPWRPAVDHLGNLWVINQPASAEETCCTTISAFSSTGTPLTATAYAPGDFTANSLAIDGFGHIWLAYEQSSPSTPAGVATFQPTGMSDPAIILGTSFAPMIHGEFLQSEVGSQTSNVAIDQSGNVWATEAGSLIDATYFYNPTLELVGLAGPVTTPLALAVKNNTLGIRP
jgi:hypothetical protein